MQQKSSDLLTIQKTKKDTTMKQNEITDDTKIIIVSDIKGSNQSILPYGLKLARYLQAEVDIVHVVDARVQQGVPSRYADSQSVTPGPKLTFDKIIEREIEDARNVLEKILSKEASSLNFPLKINKIVKEGRINDEIKETVKNGAQCLLLINEEVDDYIFQSHKEIIELIESTDAVTILVPPGIDFQLFKEIALITDFSNNFGLSSFSKTTSLLHKLNPKITAVDVARPKRFSEKELKGNKWKQVFESTIFKNIKTLVLKGKNHSDVLQQYIKKAKPDLIIYSYRKPGFINRLFHNSFLEKLLKGEEYPIIYLP